MAAASPHPGPGDVRACTSPSPLGATLSALTGMLLLHFWLPGAQVVAWPWNLVGAGVVAFAVWLAARAEREFRAHDTPVPPGVPVRALVTTGPFRFSRNPMYLGLILAATGSAIGLRSTSVWVPVIAWLGCWIAARAPRRRC